MWSVVPDNIQISTVLAISLLKDAIQRLQGVRAAAAASVAF
jgi:hypothetical protein